MTEIIGCILAGGLARRMGGGDKGLIVIAGRPILAHVIERLRPQVDAMVVNANGDPDRFAAYGLPVVADSIAGFAGPLAGVLAGLDWAAGRGAAWVVTVATDTPFLPRDLVDRLTSAAEGADLACAASGGQHHPVVGLWPVRLRENLRHAMTTDEVRKVDRWTARHRLGVADFPAIPYDPFFNANRPGDVAEAERLLSEYAP